MIRRLALVLPVVALAACAQDQRGAPATDTARPDSGAVTTPGIAPDSNPAGAAGAAAPAGDPAAATGAVLDPNAATREQLVAAGVPAGAADAMVAGRPFADMRAVDRALAQAQVDSAARRAVYARVWRPVDLNTASREEILLIPGVGARMAREFAEYRPYKDMARFRREIGKYVNEAEVARLEKFVTIR